MNRDAMIERTEEEWEALQDAIGTQPGWQVGRVLSEQDIADLRLIDRCHREDDEAATDAYHRGREDGLRERGGDELVELNARCDRYFVEHSTERAMRILAIASRDAIAALAVEGLEPFAEASAACDEPKWHDNMSAWESAEANTVNIGDFRRASTALAKIKVLVGEGTPAKGEAE